MDLGNSWVNLALQIPLALVIVFLVVKFLEHLRHVQGITMAFITEQAKVNREFLGTQREQMNVAVTRLAEEIKSNRMDVVKEVSALTTMVDRSIDRLIELEQRIEDRKSQ